jgi:LacI family transcriptional regulator
MVAHIPQKRVDKAVIDAAPPTIAVCLSDEQRHPTNPLSKLSDVSFDAADQVANLAAEHFQRRQIRSYAFVGQEETAWSDRRERAFRAQVSARGFDTKVYRHPAQQRDSDWHPSQAILVEWLIGLPKPVGILACNDEKGRQVLESCRLAGLRVPDQVAILGVDNDAVFCELADPPLSSVALDSEAAGYEAAELLDGLMQGTIRKPRRIFVSALTVVARRSTQITAVDDVLVAAAMEFIRQEPARVVSVSDVVKSVGSSRRSLEKHFRKILGRSILDEIQSVRLERAMRLLSETKLQISKIAELAGFGTTNYFVRYFKRHMGETPTDFRQRIES